MSRTKRMVEGIFFRAQQASRAKRKPKYDLFKDIYWHVISDKNTKFEIIDDHEVVTVEIARIGRLKGKVIEKAMKKFLKGNADLVVNGGESSDGRIYVYTFVITNLQNKKEKMLSLKEAAERWDDRHRPTTLLQEQCEEDDKAEVLDNPVVDGKVPSHVEKEMLSDNNIAAKKMEEFFSPTPNEEAANKDEEEFEQFASEVEATIRKCEGDRNRLINLANMGRTFIESEDEEYQKKLQDMIKANAAPAVNSAIMDWKTFHEHATVISIHPYGAAEDSEPSTSVCVVDKKFFGNHTATAGQFWSVFHITPACFYNNATVYLNGESYTVKEVYNDLEKFSQFVLVKND